MEWKVRNVKGGRVLGKHFLLPQVEQVQWTSPRGPPSALQSHFAPAATVPVPPAPLACISATSLANIPLTVLLASILPTPPSTTHSVPATRIWRSFTGTIEHISLVLKSSTRCLLCLEYIASNFQDLPGKMQSSGDSVSDPFCYNHTGCWSSDNHKF